MAELMVRIALIVICYLITAITSQRTYILQQQFLTFENHDALCLFEYDQHLASIHDSTELTQAGNDRSAQPSESSPFIGLTDETTENQFVWSDGTPWDFGTNTNGGVSPWDSTASSEPNGGTSENCVLLKFNNNNWNDFDCDIPKMALCNAPQPVYSINYPPHYHVAPSQNTIIGYIDVLDDISIQFDFIIHSFTTDPIHSNLLQIGDWDLDRLPAFTVLGNVYQHLSTAFSIPSNPNPYFDSQDNSLVLEQWNRVTFSRTQNWMSMYLNGVEVYNAPTNSHSIVFNKPIYLCYSDNDGPCTDATVSNLTITTSNSHGVDKFNYFCDATARVTIVNLQWEFYDASCWIRQSEGSMPSSMAWLGENDPTSKNWTDYTVELRFLIREGKDSGLILRAQSVLPNLDAGDYFLVALATTGSLSISRMNGAWNLLYLENVGLVTVNTNYTLRAVVRENTFEVYLDNVFRFSYNVTNPSFIIPAGSVGVRAFQSSVDFYSLKISFESDNRLYTASPTPDPTDIPTAAPSTPPTLSPSAAPSTAPTANPTSCTDYNGDSDYATDKGFNYGLILNVTNSTNSTLNRFETNSTFSYFNEKIQCNSGSNCIIKCGDIPGCLLTDIDIHNVNNEVVIRCSEELSCFRLTIATNTTSSNSSITVLCDGEETCSDIQVNVDNFNAFNLYCLSKGACNDAVINLNVSENADISDNDGIIHCVDENSCDRMEITTNSNATQLIMYEFSESVMFDNGIGYMRAENNVMCNMDKYIKYERSTDATSAHILSLIKNEYMNFAHLPCSGVTVKCGGPGDNSCIMNYDFMQNTLQSLNESSDFCTYVNVHDLQTLVCKTEVGTCIASPTSPPTPHPSMGPTQLTSSPSSAPTQPPSSAPSQSPTKAPSQPPTQSPTLSPSQSPTLNPSKSPTVSPTPSPTESPTLAPTLSPTRVPTSDTAYDSYIDTVYVIKKLGDDVHQLMEDVEGVVQDVIDRIELGYNLAYDGDLAFQYFWIKVSQINHYKISEIVKKNEIRDKIVASKDLLTLSSTIECDEWWCKKITNDFKMRQQAFEQFVTNELRYYFAAGTTDLNDSSENVQLNNELEFEVETFSDAKLLNVDEEMDLMLYGTAIVACLIASIGACAFIHNKVDACGKIPGFSVVDDGRFVSVIVFGLQLWDFSSDINLAIELWQIQDLFDHILLLIAAMGSTAFVLIPYIANLIIASRIKNIIRNNQHAKGWFQYNTAIFTVLVVLCGGAYPALAVVSSNMFGLNITSSGLTKYELQQMGRLKVWGTVILENIPQLVFQVLYASASGELTDNLKVAFIASTLSATASTLSYLIQSDASDTKVVQYYLSTESSRTLTSLDTMDEGDMISKPSEAFGQEIVETGLISEKDNFVQNRGKTLELARRIAEVFAIPQRNIEVGYSTLTQYGIITHIVHYIYQSDLEALEMQLDNGSALITAKFFAAQLYASFSEEINEVFRTHFGISQAFKVTFNHQMGIKKASMASAKNDDDDPDPRNKHVTDRNDRRSMVLKQMVSHTKLLGVNFSASSMPTMPKQATIDVELDEMIALDEIKEDDNEQPIEMEMQPTQVTELQYSQCTASFAL
eukprot:1009058_1